MFGFLNSKHYTDPNTQRHRQHTHKRVSSSSSWISPSPNVELRQQKRDQKPEKAPDGSSDHLPLVLFKCEDERNHYDSHEDELVYAHKH